MSYNTESRIARTVTAGRTHTHTRYETTRRGALVEAVVWWAAAWELIQRVWHAVVRQVGQTVTPAGWVAVFAVLVLPVGWVLGWTELAVAGLVAVVLLVIALPFLAGGRAYEVDFAFPVERVVAGGQVHGSLRVANVSKRIELPGRVDVPIGTGLTDIPIPLMRPGAVHAEVVTVEARKRGIIDVGPVTMVRTDPIGLLHRDVAWPGTHRLYVHPATVVIPSTSSGFVRDLEGNPAAKIVDSDISFHAIREYAAGDSRRNVHWKSTAKTGKLMVRQFEESRRSRLAVALSLHTADYADAEEFELAVSAAGSLGGRAIRDGRDVAVVASEEIPELAKVAIRSVRTLGVVSGRALLDDLSGVELSTATMPIDDVCGLVPQVIPDVSIAFVICGSTVTPARLRALSLRFPAGVAVVAVRCDREAEPSYRDLAGTGVLTIAVLDDLRALLARRAA